MIHYAWGKCKPNPQDNTSPIRMTTILKQKTSVGKDVEKLELMGTVGGDVKWCRH